MQQQQKKELNFSHTIHTLARHHKIVKKINTNPIQKQVKLTGE